ncbi:MAG: hypothetical protein HQL49_10635 [Gammaproteobacteria bacterium]|nr:hypothetical protein [Gammaproteobacteria bacterium]
MNRTEAEQTLLDTLANAVAVAEVAKTFAEVWRGGERSLETHIDTRLKYGHIDSLAEYPAKTVAAMENAKAYLVAKGGYETMVAIDAGDWVLVYTFNGTLVTAYQKEASIEAFDQRHARLGWTVNEVTQNDNIRAESDRLLLQYRKFLPG